MPSSKSDAEPSRRPCPGRTRRSQRAHTAAYGPSCLETHLSPRLRPQNEKWDFPTPDRLVDETRDHFAALSATSVTTTTKERGVVRVVHGRGHPRSR